MQAIAVIAIAVFGYALVSERLAMAPVTAPMVFTAIGLIIGTAGLELVDQDNLTVGVIGALARATLILLLFTDAIRIDLRRLRETAQLPVRLLLIGLPLTVIAGTLLGVAMFGGLGLAGAFALAAILTPTDAALGKAVVSNPSVPVRVRQTINVESGLNDGLMLPVVTVAIAFVGTAEDVAPAQEWFVFALEQIGFGVGIGVAVGWLGGKVLDRFAQRGWIEGAFRQLATLAIGVGAFAIAEVIHGNGFVAAFVAGLAFGAAARGHCDTAYHFAEDEGELLALLTFLAFGATVVGPALGDATVRTAVYAVLSLTLIRMVPVAVSLIGTRLKLPTVAYIAWFGPRGLASILFGVFLLEETGDGMSDAVFEIVVLTVVLSILAHGATAAPVSRRYAAWFERSGRPEMEDEFMPEFPMRG